MITLAMKHSLQFYLHRAFYRLCHNDTSQDSRKLWNTGLELPIGNWKHWNRGERKVWFIPCGVSPVFSKRVHGQHALFNHISFNNVNADRKGQKYCFNCRQYLVASDCIACMYVTHGSVALIPNLFSHRHTIIQQTSRSHCCGWWKTWNCRSGLPYSSQDTDICKVGGIAWDQCSAPRALRVPEESGLYHIPLKYNWRSLPATDRREEAEMQWILISAI